MKTGVPVRLASFWLLAVASPALAQTSFSPSPAACAAEIRSFTSEFHLTYRGLLQSSMEFYQKEGDLDGFLAARAELQRFDKEKTVASKHLVAEPRDLAWEQSFLLNNAQSSILEIVEKHAAALLPQQRRLTQTGKIEEAIKVRQQIQEIRALARDWAPPATEEGAKPPDFVPAGVLARLYQRDPQRMDLMIKGRRVLVEGTVHDFAIDSSNGSVFRIILSDRGEPPLKVECPFDIQAYTFRRTSGGDRAYATIERKDSTNHLPITIAKGTRFSVEGVIQGRHLNILLSQVSIPLDSWKERPKAETPALARVRPKTPAP